LSWIQDFFQRLNKNEEEQLDNEKLHTSNSGSYFQNLNKEPSKNIDAKIAYQYPKGRFRFPLIPDEGIPRKRDEPKVHTKRRNTEEKKTNAVEYVPHKKVQTHSKNEPLQKKRINGPFRPTEIPSPIFGFKRPVMEEKEVVEHELTHFSDSNLFENQDKFIKNNEQANIGENKIDLLSIDQKEIILEEKPENIVEPEMILEEKPENIAKPEIISHEEPEIVEEPEITIQERHENLAESIFEDHSITTANEGVIIHQSDEAEAMQDASSKEELDEKSDQVDSVPDQPRRSHLPFNVIMLKQDKEKWEQKRMNMEEKSLLPVGEKLEPALEPQSIEITGNATTFEELQGVETTEDVVQISQMQPIEGNEKSESNDITIPEENYGYSSVDTYVLPTFQLLKPPVSEPMDSEWVMTQEELLNQTLENFNVGASVVNVTQGPSVTRFEVQPEPGVKVNKVTNLTDDIKLSLAARDIRIEAPIPGKHTIGIEVPNLKSRPVLISEIIQSNIFLEAASPLTAVLGLDISGKPIVTDLKKMPHGLIAGATGSGKSVCINSMLISLLYKASPEDLKLLLIDPKVVELAPYNHIPHLVSPVITDVKAATAALKWAVDEMERRYQLFAHTGVRDINRFNDLAMEHKRYSEKLPFIVIVIDELADLMMMSPADVEEAICRIAQKARACGIHLIIATQRPSVDVITGLIKANIPTRIAFSVSSQVDSRTIIDISGAEKLLGRGDMLFLENGSSKPVRLQGTFVSDEEIDFVVAHIREQREPDYLFEQEELLKKAQVLEEEDELFYEACEFVVEQGGASTSSLQRRFKIGYNRAARLMDLMEQNGYISGANGSKPRDVLINETDLEAMQTN
jgi:DNA segregation ATPase FtsK/SpoIIIE, S-DNA-T family